jgi:hypothetical protein
MNGMRISTERLPFTDETLENEGYRETCDELSEKEVSMGIPHFGRWYIEDGYICTWVIVPQVENVPIHKLFIYDFAIEVCLTKERQEQWLEHMKEKNWIGEKGINDLKKLFKKIKIKQGEC